MRCPLSTGIAAALSLAALVAGCSSPPPSTPVRAATPLPVRPRPPVPTPAAVGADWRDWPVTPGTWSYRQDARGSIALFGTTGGNAVLTLRCDRAPHSIYLSRAGSAAAPLTVRTTTLTRLVAVRPTGGDPTYAAAAFSSGDPLLDAMGFSRGRFVIEQQGVPPLVVPAWAEVERVVEDCRS